MPSLQFKGKVFVQNHHLVVPFHELTPVKSRGLSKKVSLHDNLIIEGDNLAALKALLPTYQGKVKCIYIDPPYNTGNENWIYNDNVNSPMMQEWLGKVVDREDLTRHDKWCCMMMPRLKLLRELLSSDGVIFVSISDIEVHRVRCLMDEVFEEQNFITDFIWNSEGHTDNQFPIKVNHEHIIAYARSADSTVIGNVVDPNTREESNLWKGFAENSITKNGPGNPPSEVILPAGFPCEVSTLEMPASKISKGLVEDMVSQVLTSSRLKKKYPGTQFPLRKDPIRVKNGKLVSSCRLFSGWANVRKLSEFIANKFSPVDESGSELTFYLSKNGVVYYKRVREEAQNIVSVLGNFGTTEQMSSQLEQLGIRYKYPKPVLLIQHLLKIGGEKDSTILDAFAGSGTTAHAVLALNKADRGDRRFIVCQMPYETKEQEKKGENICETVTAERVRRVIRGVPKANDENLRTGLGGTFSYFKLGKPLRLRAILEGSALPDYESLASYVFFTATGEEFDPRKIDKKTWFIGESRKHDVFLIYQPDSEKLKQLSRTLDLARALPSVSGKQKLVFAPTKYLDPYFLDSLRITFQQLPYQIYKALET